MAYKEMKILLAERKKKLKALAKALKKMRYQQEQVKKYSFPPRLTKMVQAKQNYELHKSSAAKLRRAIKKLTSQISVQNKIYQSCKQEATSGTSRAAKSAAKRRAAIFVPSTSSDATMEMTAVDTSTSVVSTPVYEPATVEVVTPEVIEANQEVTVAIDESFEDETMAEKVMEQLKDPKVLAILGLGGFLAYRQFAAKNKKNKKNKKKG